MAAQGPPSPGELGAFLILSSKPTLPKNVDRAVSLSFKLLFRNACGLVITDVQFHIYHMHQTLKDFLTTGQRGVWDFSIQGLPGRGHTGEPGI